MQRQPLFVEGYLYNLYKSGKRPNLKEPKSSLPEVPNGFTMLIIASFKGNRQRN